MVCRGQAVLSTPEHRSVALFRGWSGTLLRLEVEGEVFKITNYFESSMEMEVSNGMRKKHHRKQKVLTQIWNSRV
jgi:hypothetical protein